MEYHEAANIFPLDEDHIAELAKDIKANGLARPIELIDGKIIDGRRRYLACKKAGVTASFEAVSVDDPVTYVLSLNLHRRHLTTSQAAACAARAESLRDKLAEDAKERMKSGKKNPGANCPEGRTRDQIGAMFGVSGKSVERAKEAIVKGIPELVAAIDAGKISVNKAQYISTHERPLQKDLLEAELDREQYPQKRAEPREPDEKSNGDTRIQGVGVLRAHEAINCLIRIPKNDALRKRGFQIVTDWIKANK